MGTRFLSCQHNKDIYMLDNLTFYSIFQDHNRKSGRLIILSGATGKVVGTRYLAAPDHKEIYMSPVMYTTKDGSQYILFGSGGETIPGK